MPRKNRRNLVRRTKKNLPRLSRTKQQVIILLETNIMTNIFNSPIRSCNLTALIQSVIECWTLERFSFGQENAFPTEHGSGIIPLWYIQQCLNLNLASISKKKGWGNAPGDEAIPRAGARLGEGQRGGAVAPGRSTAVGAQKLGSVVVKNWRLTSLAVFLAVFRLILKLWAILTLMWLIWRQFSPDFRA